MPAYKHKWLLECANAFGMSVSEFAECIGYTRQAIYQANEGTTRLEPRRLAVAQYKLEVISEKMHEEEIAVLQKAQTDIVSITASTQTDTISAPTEKGEPMAKPKLIGASKPFVPNAKQGRKNKNQFKKVSAKK